MFSKNWHPGVAHSALVILMTVTEVGSCIRTIKASSRRIPAIKSQAILRAKGFRTAYNVPAPYLNAILYQPFAKSAAYAGASKSPGI